MGNAPSLQHQIEAAVSALIGKPIWAARRCLNMEMFDIGDRIAILTHRGETVEVGEYRLHVQAPWRVIGPSGVAVGSVDAHYPPSDREDDAFDPNNDRSLCEEKVEAWFHEHREPAVIESVTADASGGVRLMIRGQEALEVFPASGRPDYEHWRLIGPGSKSPPHFVVAGVACWRDD